MIYIYFAVLYKPHVCVCRFYPKLTIEQIYGWRFSQLAHFQCVALEYCSKWKMSSSDLINQPVGMFLMSMKKIKYIIWVKVYAHTHTYSLDFIPFQFNRISVGTKTAWWVISGKCLNCNFRFAQHSCTVIRAVCMHHGITERHLMIHNFWWTMHVFLLKCNFLLRNSS